MNGESAPKVDGALGASHLETPWPPPRLEHNLARIKARIVRRSRVVKAATAGVVVVMAAALALFFEGRAASVATLPARTALRPTPEIKSSKTTFVDGSVARVANGGELVVNLATPQRIESVLRSGSVEFEVTKRPERDFIVVAGPVKVHVVGTRFVVERLGERTRVSVSEGKVEVLESASTTFLEAGESRFFPSPAPIPSGEARASATPSARSRFLELSRGGDYKAAYQVLSQSPSVVGTSAEDLMLAADAARLSNHPEQALGYLRRVTGEHAADSRAPLAAFTLGRVLLSQLGRPADAAEAFALARRLKPGGSLAEDALAREAESRSASGAKARAASLARDYLARYPRGKHGSTMQRLMAQL